MFQALGAHGPVLTPLASALLDITLVSVAFAFFVGGSRTNRMTMGMLATMVVAMAALRVLMQPLPNVQPVTVAALLVGAHLGARRGVAFAILATLLSNLLISHGWWTLFQAAGWGIVAVIGARANLVQNGQLQLQRLALVSVVSAMVFGFVSTLSLVTSAMTPSAFIVLLGQGLPFDVVHALGNLVFVVWMAPSLHHFLSGLAASENESLAVGEVHGLDA
ncbi:MAG: hypothetical protein CMB74_02295 [Euryarchaeota archaeon]|nr:hypothetical protein [Euryarchaeota archaeon]|tara:strand:- start:5266 stop:5925 length:660 start_codon:yes stop_codon:yes gene_type:complete